MSAHDGWMYPLFVPADRPDRFAKAAASGADAIVIDLEDAVRHAAKTDARANLGVAQGLDVDIIVRINGFGTEWFEEDIQAVRACGAAAIMLPKADDPDVVAIAHRASRRTPIIALLETARVVGMESRIAQAEGVVQLAFGTQDLAAELGCSPRSRLFDSVRLALVAASAQAGLAPPLDGVDPVFDDGDRLTCDARDLVEIGFAGRLLIHPLQVLPTARGLAPTASEVAVARRIAETVGGASQVDGRMVDQPVRRQAERVLARARRLGGVAVNPADRI